MVLKPFCIPHDAADPVGYNIFSDGIKMTVATDIGHIDDTVREAVADSDVLLLEANREYWACMDIWQTVLPENL